MFKINTLNAPSAAAKERKTNKLNLRPAPEAKHVLIRKFSGSMTAGCSPRHVTGITKGPVPCEGGVPRPNGRRKGGEVSAAIKEGRTEALLSGN